VTTEPRRIESAANPLLVRLRRLASDPAAYRRLGEVLLEGDHLCAAWLERGGAVASVAVVSEAGWDEPALRNLARQASRVAIVAPALMAASSDLESPPRIVFVVPWRGAGVLQPAAPSLVLDRLQDAGNVGTLLRSAAAFGFTQVLALKGTAALWAPRVLRAGMGAHFALDLAEGLGSGDLAALAVPLLATSSHAGRAIGDAALPWPCAFAFGNEGQGLAEAVRARCIAELRIPQPGGGESLNVAAAAAICLYESARQRAAALSLST
jgi:RNA methyltransferase, TrmH family